MDQGLLIFALERQASGQHLIQDDAQRPNIRALIDGLTFGLLRRHVGHGAYRGAFPRQLDLAGQFRQSEVDDLGHAFAGHQDIGRLEITVNDPLLMGLGHAPDGLEDDVERLFLLERPPLDLVPKAFAFIVGHDDIHPAVFRLFDLVNVADIGMIESRGGSGFLDEPLPRIGVRGPLVRQEFQGHGALELDILGLVDDAHPAAANFLDDPVFPGDDASTCQPVDGRLKGLGERNGGLSFRGERRCATAAKPGRIGVIAVTLWTFHDPMVLSPVARRITPSGREVKRICFLAVRENDALGSHLPLQPSFILAPNVWMAAMTPGRSSLPVVTSK